MVLKIEPLDRGKHLRSDFSCGKESLDRYLHQQASQDLKRRVSAVFVLIDEPNVEVLGYYTLSSFSIDISALQEETAKRLPRYPTLPSTLLDRLAVSQTQ